MSIATIVLSYFIVFMLGVIVANQTQIVKNMKQVRLNSEALRAQVFAPSPLRQWGGTTNPYKAVPLTWLTTAVGPTDNSLPFASGVHHMKPGMLLRLGGEYGELVRISRDLKVQRGMEGTQCKGHPKNTTVDDVTDAVLWSYAPPIPLSDAR